MSPDPGSGSDAGAGGTTSTLAVRDLLEEDAAEVARLAGHAFSHQDRLILARTGAVRYRAVIQDGRPVAIGILAFRHAHLWPQMVMLPAICDLHTAAGIGCSLLLGDFETLARAAGATRLHLLADPFVAGPSLRIFTASGYQCQSQEIPQDPADRLLLMKLLDRTRSWKRPGTQPSSP